MAENLVLEVIESPPEANMTGHTKIFPGTGGSLGRADTNSWIIPDFERIISSHHADIVFNNGSYTLIDKSTNGTFINGSDSPLGAGGQVQLKDGDIIGLGLYQIKARLVATTMGLPEGLGEVDFLDGSDKTTIGSIAQTPEPETGTAPDPFDPFYNPNRNEDAGQSLWAETPQSFSETPLDPLAAFADDSSNIPATSSPDAHDPLAAFAETSGTNKNPWDNQSSDDDWWLSEPDDAPAIAQSIAIPKPETETESQPEVENKEPDLDDMSLEQLLQAESQPSPEEKAPIPEPKKPVGRHPSSASSRSLLAEELGLSTLDSQAIRYLEAESAKLIKETVCRLMDLLRARSCIKNELRVERTMIQSQDNNPLKFSATTEDAISILFGAGNMAYLPPSEAIREGFDNISDHQVAVLAAMREAYEHMITGFSPQTLETLFERTGQNRGMFSKNAKNWSDYKAWYQEMLKDHENTYNRLFGEIFATTYEKKLAELDSARKL